MTGADLARIVVLTAEVFEVSADRAFCAHVKCCVGDVRRGARTVGVIPEFGLHVGRAEAKELGRSTTRGIYAGALRNGPAVASVPVGAIAVGTLNLDVRQIGGGGG